MKYLYITCEAPRHDLTLLSFAHVRVQARDQTEAYSKGLRYFTKHPSKVSKEGYVFMNDYVVRL